MSKQWLQISLKEPLLLGQAKANTQTLSSMGYIPGRMLRGAWVEWLLSQGHSTDIPETVNQVHIGNFFPATNWRPVHYASPFLLSMLSCKHYAGFKDEREENDTRHGVVDTLIPQLAYLLLKQAGATFTVPFYTLCASCSSRMESQSGWFDVYKDGKRLRYAQIRHRSHAQTRVALSRYRRAAHDGMLYTASAISPSIRETITHKDVALTFIGWVQGSDEHIQEIIEAANEVSIGAMRTRGYGCIHVERCNTSLPSILERIKTFNSLLVSVWNDLRHLAINSDTLPIKPQGSYFSVDLLAPGVFHQQGMPSLCPNLSILGQVLPPVYWLTRPEFVGGWSDAWGLPKPTALAARAGSTYVYQWPQLANSDFISALERIEVEGLGERRDESLGESWICHPFHQEINEI